MYLEGLLFWGAAALVIAATVGGIISFIEEVNRIRF